MTREDAKAILKDCLDKAEYKHGAYGIALDMAIKALEQGPYKDAISRRAMHIELEKWITYGEYKYSNATKYLYDRIDRLPSVNPQPKTGHWIHVSEKLPEDAQTVLFCDIDNDIMVGYHIKGRPNTHFVQDGTFEDMKNVRAWMPLPKPYEPQESEDKE